MLRWLDDHLEEFLMAVLLLLITVIISYSVVMRYVFNDSPTWAEEITRFFFIWSAFLSIGLCIRRQPFRHHRHGLLALWRGQRHQDADEQRADEPRPACADVGDLRLFGGRLLAGDLPQRPAVFDQY